MTFSVDDKNPVMNHRWFHCIMYLFPFQNGFQTASDLSVGRKSMKHEKETGQILHMITCTI